jgi:septum formation protein
LATLRRAGVDPEVIVSRVDESQIEAADPIVLVSRLAQLKAEAVLERLGPAGETDPLVVIGCDSVLVFEGRPCGKPGGPAAAVELWRRVRGRTALLVSGHHVVVRDGDGPNLDASAPERRAAPPGRAGGGGLRRANRVGRTVVHFADLSEAEIEAYVATGEPAQVAGGFTIDGLGGPFITRIEGDPHNVVGLSLPLLRMMLADLGVAWSELWRLDRPAAATDS